MFQKIISTFNKKNGELEFQKKWSPEFNTHKNKVLQYWKDYRYLDEINKICTINNTKKILDVGCGISTILHFIDGKEKVGIDPLAKKYKKLYKYPTDITIKKSDGENIPYKSEYFDIVFCSNVIDHVTNTEETLNEIHRVLKKDGFFVLTVELFEKKIQRNAAHPHCIIESDINNLMPADKFQNIFYKKTEWIGLRAFVNGATTGKNEELITIWQKK